MYRTERAFLPFLGAGAWAMRRNLPISRLLQDALYQAAQNLQSLKMVRADEAPDVDRLKNDLMAATSSVQQLDNSLLRQPLVTGDEQKPNYVSGETEERIGAGGDRFSTIRQRLEIERSRMRDQFERTRKNRFAMMTNDLDVGLTLAKIAARSLDACKKYRNHANARIALNTIANMLPESTLTEDERGHIEAKIADLRAALESFAP